MKVVERPKEAKQLDLAEWMNPLLNISKINTKGFTHILARQWASIE